MRNIVGRPVRGQDFFDRDQERELAWRSLETNHLLLLAPRRVGKTSLMLQLHAEGRERGHNCVYESAARDRSEMALIGRLYLAAAKEHEGVREAMLRGHMARALRKVESVGVLGVELKWRDLPDEDWSAVGDELIEAIRSTGEPWLLLLDELPIFVLALLRLSDGTERARAFLDWFRDARQGPVAGPDRARWILAGSIGLDAVTQRLGLGTTINDLLLFRLGPFSQDTAVSFLSALAEGAGVDLDEDTRLHACRRIGWLIPHHLQVLFHALGERGWSKTDSSAVDAVMDDLAAPGNRAYFDTWYQRLTEELGAPRDGWARELLTACARDSDGAPRSVLDGVIGRAVRDPQERDRELAWLLAVLENDGYLVPHDGRYRFRSPLLRGYWLARVG